MTAETVVCGIPALNEEATVANVTEMVDEGLSALGAGTSHIILGDNASTDTTVAAFRSARTRAPTSVVAVPERGKGNVVLAVVERALELGADYVAFFDADVTSGRATWVGDLVGTSRETGADLVLPEYLTSQGGPLTNLVVRPLVYYMTGRSLAQPVGGEMCLSRDMALRLAAGGLPAVGRHYGVDVHIALSALADGQRVAATRLGVKRHRPRGWATINNIVEEVFEALQHFYRSRGCLSSAASVMDAVGDPGDVGPLTRNVPAVEPLEAAARDSASRYGRVIETTPESCEVVDRIVSEAPAGASDPGWWAESLVALVVNDAASSARVAAALEVLFLWGCVGLARSYQSDDLAGDHFAVEIIRRVEGLR